MNDSILKESKYLSVVIPCYNEEANLSIGVLEQVHDFLSRQDYSYEVIIVNDASTDRSYTLCSEFSKAHPDFRVISVEHGGKPSAIFHGVMESKGEIILLSDMDQSTPIYELEKLLSCYNQGYDFIIGSRGKVRSGYSILRKVASWVFLSLRKIFLLPEINDTQCGFKLIRADAARDIFPFLSFLTKKQKAKGWVVSAYDVELIYIATKKDYKIKEINVEWEQMDQSLTKSRKFGRFFMESIDMALEVLAVCKNNILGKYDFSDPSK